VTGFLAVDDVIAGFYAHEELDAVWALSRLSAAAFQINWPSFCYAKDVEGGTMEAGLYHRR